jgi:cytochrome P450
MAEVTFDTSTAGWLDDPYPQYRALREHDPVHWSESLDHWVLTRHRDVASALKDPRLSAANRPPQRRWGRPTTMVTSDPPDHSRLRRPVNHRFTADSVDALRPRIQRIVDELIERGVDGRTLDIVSRLARRLPNIIISDMLGIDPGDLAPAQSASSPTGMATSTVLPADSAFLDAMERHREEPGNDGLLDDLIAAQMRGRMNAEEALDTAQILYAAGQETTAKMISSAVYYLLQWPDQLGKLRANPSLLPNAVEELLRFDTPVHAIARKAIKDFHLDGKQIARDDKVLCVIAAANRDPEVFERPEVLDIQRQPAPHLTFGTGAHLCLGAGLARAEVEASIGTLISRFPKMRLAEGESVEWEGSLIIRGLRRLLVDCGA